MFEHTPVSFLRSWGWQTDEFFRNVPLNTPRARLFDVVSIDFLPAGVVVITYAPWLAVGPGASDTFSLVLPSETFSIVVHADTED
jgi:hypothetical protein